MKVGQNDIDMPITRAINPVTKTDWEGTGGSPESPRPRVSLPLPLRALRHAHSSPNCSAGR